MCIAIDAATPAIQKAITAMSKKVTRNDSLAYFKSMTSFFFQQIFLHGRGLWKPETQLDINWPIWNLQKIQWRYFPTKPARLLLHKRVPNDLHAIILKPYVKDESQRTKGPAFYHICKCSPWVWGEKDSRQTHTENHTTSLRGKSIQASKTWCSP